MTRRQASHGKNGHRQISEYGKLTPFYPSVLFHDDILRDGRDTAVISCTARPTAAVYLTLGLPFLVVQTPTHDLSVKSF
jgi:hypothetical protein